MATLAHDVVRDLRSCWKTLALADIIYKSIAFILLVPLTVGLFRVLIALSGSPMLSDIDIVYFLLGPAGWTCFIAAGSLWLGIVALEQASLIGILAAQATDQELGPAGALYFAACHAGTVLRVTARMVAWTLLAMAPFVAVAAVVYFALLTEHDINYYLHEQPPVFRTALGAGALLAFALAALLLYMFSGWTFALPLVLLEAVPPRDALRLSAARAHGHRRVLLRWIVAWALAVFAVSGLTTGVIGSIGRLVIPRLADSLQLLALAMGATLLVWAAVGLALNLLSTTTLASILLALYREFGCDVVRDSWRFDAADGAFGRARFRLPKRYLLPVIMFGITIAIAFGAFALPDLHLQDNVKIMAHRGSSQAAPENTLAAVRQAIEERADWVEIDVQETADGEVVVLHDSDFMKLAGRDLKIWNATMADLQDIDVGSWFAAEFKDERVPSLAELLDECQGKIRVNIELKYYGHDQQLEQRVADIVHSRGMAADVMVMSLKMAGVRKMKSICPDWKVGLLLSVSAGDLKKSGADFLAVNARFADRGFIRRAHAHGKEVYVWTVNDAPTMSAMMSRGVDGLLTDKPALARSVLDQRAAMSLSERLLMELAALIGTRPTIADQ